MVVKGWVTRRSSLLTEAEAKYFNYFLNGVEFSNGPQLRNKYLYGSQANEDGEGTHFSTYITALRLTVALVIQDERRFLLVCSRGFRLEEHPLVLPRLFLNSSPSHTNSTAAGPMPFAVPRGSAPDR